MTTPTAAAPTAVPTRYRLAISNAVKFDCVFTLADGDQQREFGMAMEAARAKQPKQGDGTTVGEFLSGPAAVRMAAWKGDSPLVDIDTGQPIAAGADALAALYDLVPNLPGLVLAAYLDATGAKAKLGN